MTQTATRTTPHDSPPSRTFSQSEIEEFRKTFNDAGYLVFRDVVSKDKLSSLRTRIQDEFERQKESGGLFSGGGLISGHLNCFPGEESRFVLDELEERGILEVVNAISPKSMGKLNVGCNLNLPKSVPQHYHADGNFTGDFMIVNVAVVDTELANGAIDLLRGTHQEFHPFWRYALKRLYRLSTRIPMKQGDVLVRKSTLWHRGMPNHTATARPMVALTFGDPGSPRFDEPYRVNDGKITFYENWYRTNFLGRVRERTFVAAPITYSTYRFVRSLVGKKGYDA